ncbi:unnamed protein product, partial [Owenia fusiformis]
FHPFRDHLLFWKAADCTKKMSRDEKIAIIGSGLIGRSWAMLFASVGYKVCIYDILSEQIDSALKEILVQLKKLEESGLLRGKISAVEQHKLITGCTDFKECVAGAKHVQECVPESIELKRKVFEQLDAVADDKMVLCSSTSTMPASSFTEHLTHRAQCIVAHPTNPPFYCPLTELVPSPWTYPHVTKNTREILEEIGQSVVLLNKEKFGFALNRLQWGMMSEIWRLVQTNPPYYAPLVEVVPAPWTNGVVISNTKSLLEEIGQTPVVLKKEVLGFVLNRIQYALLNECWRLVQDGTISVEDVDKVMSDGLGMRYAFMGPLETAYLNADGWKSYSERYADTIFNVAQDFGPTPRMEGETLEIVHNDLASRIPLDKLNERRAWRDARLAGLAKLKKEMNEK